MAYYVYILKSTVDGTYYKGYTEDYEQRLIAHNEGKTLSTAARRPWMMIYAEECPTKREALIREKKLKKCKADYFEWLVTQSSNILG